MPSHDRALATRPVGVATTTEQCLTESLLGRTVTEAVSPSTAEVTKASVAGQAHCLHKPCAVGVRSGNVPHVAVLGPRCRPFMVDVISIVGRGYQPTHLVPPYPSLLSRPRRDAYWVVTECLREHERACTPRANTAATTSPNSVQRKTTKLSERQSVYRSGSQTNRFLNGCLCHNLHSKVRRMSAPNCHRPSERPQASRETRRRAYDHQRPTCNKNLT